MSTYFFTYGTDDGMPYYGGWTEIEAPDAHTACELFRAYHPDKKEGFLNCSLVYSKDSFDKTEMPKTGNFGKFCVERIRVTRVENEKPRAMIGKICPKCGNPYLVPPALSRRDNTTEICPRCGMLEAIEDWTRGKEEEH